MDARRFSNALRIMTSLDRHELVGAGVIAAEDAAGWCGFAGDPFRAVLRFDDERQQRLWALIESRQPNAQEERQ